MGVGVVARWHLKNAGLRFVWQRRGIPKGARRLAPFGCSRHRDKGFKKYRTSLSDSDTDKYLMR